MNLAGDMPLLVALPPFPVLPSCESVLETAAIHFLGSQLLLGAEQEGVLTTGGVVDLLQTTAKSREHL
eukprot:CAMPEP_0195074294 /NCGR_PEP_ID=MMETSP0448-20130528/17442_1 /TAXON_ID=66468 /ORGANISM="Heterocapsa triquestra, Strain CCMP 448" /LENGTH=67 /DNA_ID=CAMNT_0040106527 /DNA_START=62 /DNA_END=262 /DNA_ORIENTATION=+